MTILVSPHVPEPTATISPVKISHCSIRTADVPAMKAWYETVLGAQIVFESDRICLLTFDSEHHRVALIHADKDEARPRSAIGLQHVAMTYADIGDLISTYERLKAAGIKPDMTINHGPTTSFYYCDPDGNHLELLVDNFASVADLNAWFETGAHERHPGGEPFDADELARKFHAGETLPEILR